MTPLLHTFIATGMVAVAYYIGVWVGHRQGQKEGAVDMIALFSDMGYGSIPDMLRDLENYRDRDTDN